MSLLEDKRTRNPNYSIRALARDLEIPASSLVDIINKKKTVTPQIAYKIASHMKLTNGSMLDFLLPSIKPMESLQS